MENLSITPKHDINCKARKEILYFTKQKYRITAVLNVETDIVVVRPIRASCDNISGMLIRSKLTLLFLSVM
jgi:hypothetical protein